jgi:hypothetical protein
MIISNEFDGDDEAKLNGAFVKSLASGGDAMAGRKLYENTISFIPQITMLLCYNILLNLKNSNIKVNSLSSMI